MWRTLIAGLVVACLLVGCKRESSNGPSTGRAAATTPTTTRAPSLDWDEELRSAVLHGDIERARAGLTPARARGADADGWTLLHWAAHARQKSPEMIGLLVAAGCPVDAVDRAGMTALDLAARNDAIEAMRALMASGANPNLGRPRPPLYDAAMMGHVPVVRLLLEKGADPNGGVPEGGETPLHMAYTHADVARLLITAGADINRRSPKQKTALVRAAEGEQWDTVRVLIESGADPTLPDDAGWTALHYAAIDGPVDIVEALCRRGAKADAPNERGQTPVQFARERKDAESVLHALARAAATKSATQSVP